MSSSVTLGAYSGGIGVRSGTFTLGRAVHDLARLAGIHLQAVPGLGELLVVVRAKAVHETMVALVHELPGLGELVVRRVRDGLELRYLHAGNDVLPITPLVVPAEKRGRGGRLLPPRPRFSP